MLRRVMPLPINRIVAAAIALLVTAVIVVAIIFGAGNRQLATASRSVVGRDSYCRGFAADTAVSAVTQPQRGRYANPVYGYAVTIPNGRAGFAPAGAPARGIVIPLANQPHALLRVDAAYDALYDITAAGVHTSDRVDVQLFDRLLSDQAQPFSLGGIQGGRYRMQVLCRGASRPYEFESIIVIRKREIYRLDLQTQTDRLRQDESLLEAMAGSWSWIP
ncbi:MAG TPA: hypothetical protein VHY19_14595 [Steroidobacteraceae bacterium]|jgi:hypothetical protein|nr:hypothetical protein [Steroidobacteraceae bacterium]